MGKNQYIIQFGGLAVGIHDFEFTVTEKFFQSIENSEIEKANVLVKAKLIKQNNLLNVEFEIKGDVGIECDRCLKDFDFPIEGNEKLVVKHGNPAESNDDILVIKEGAAEFDISTYIYEYILLAIPVRKVPCEIDDEKYECDYEALKKLESISADSEIKETQTNPIWEELNKLKKNKN